MPASSRAGLLGQVPLVAGAHVEQRVAGGGELVSDRLHLALRVHGLKLEWLDQLPAAVLQGEPARSAA